MHDIISGMPHILSLSMCHLHTRAFLNVDAVHAPWFAELCKAVCLSLSYSQEYRSVWHNAVAGEGQQVDQAALLISRQAQQRLQAGTRQP